jgi:LysM repeat protein
VDGKRRLSLDRGAYALAGLTAAALIAASPDCMLAQSLRGSASKLNLQNEVADDHDFTYLRTRQQVQTFVELGLLVPVEPSTNLELNEVSFPYTRPEVALFVDRLASQYQQACGQKLVVTSLTRPLSDQPANASDRSVHPTGMAVDLRYNSDRKCRSWLEGVLLQLADNGVLDATRESRPPHYHVVVFPRQYSGYVESLGNRLAESVSTASTSVPASTPEAATAQRIQYTVRRGDSLWTIAQKLGTTVEVIQQENDLRTSRIFAGQVISVPAK